MQCMQVQIPQPPRALVKHADDKQGGKRLCRLSPGHKQTQRRHSPNAVTIHATDALSQRENQDSSPLLSSPPLRAASPAEGTRKERALPFPTRRLSLGSASPALFSIKTSIFLKSGDIMQQQRGERKPARTTCRSEGAAIKAATLRWRVPS